MAEEKITKSRMNLHLVLALHDPDDAPEIVLCWDEFCIEGNEDGWIEARLKALETYGDTVQYREVIVQTQGIPELFDVPKVEGTIVEE